MNKQVQRNFIIGDNWLYYKIYTGSRTSDMVLQEIIKPITDSLLESGIIDKWFFIRYADPKPHLRIRFHCPDTKNIGIVMSKLLPALKELSSQDLIWKIQTDTYSRELERYGQNTIEISETLFFYDSTLIVNLLELNDHDEDGRWQLSLMIIDNLLDNFGFSIDEKLMFMERLKGSFGAEFGMNKDLNKQIDFKYRKFRYKIEEMLSVGNYEASEYSEIKNALHDFNTNISSLAKVLIHLKESDLLTIPMHYLLSSYIHMSMVRLFKSNNRMHEMVIYDFLYRFYKSCKARGKSEIVCLVEENAL